MALSSGVNLYRRGAANGRSDFGYPVAPGETIWRGGIVGINAAGQLQRVQTSGTVALAGVADQDYSNVGNSGAGQIVAARKGCWALPVTSATVSNIGANVYATDDGACQLTAPGSGYEAVIGTLAGIDNGQTYVLLAGS
ncbi:MAG: hypothetical protein ACREFT_10590 [Acetobacteraceae bacterium]